MCMAVGAIAMLLYVLFRWKYTKLQEEANAGATGKIRLYNWMGIYIKYIYPIVLLFVFICLVQVYF